MYVDTSNTGARCEICKFARGSYLKSGVGAIFCHRFPPVFSEDADTWVMPETSPKAWCGEYKRFLHGEKRT